MKSIDVFSIESSLLPRLCKRIIKYLSLTGFNLGGNLSNRLLAFNLVRSYLSRFIYSCKIKIFLMKNLNILSLLLLTLSLSSCGVINTALNPFYEEPSEVALQGEANDHALNENRSKLDTARDALTAVGQYESALPAQPNNPVLRPAIVRLMWIPDHLNSYGDLVPAHYYYLKVLPDRWRLQDAFELESQLKGSRGDASNVPYVLK